ncbi:Gfo/Idh/MocA family protein [Crateriforma conspicua]|uniref:Inositol 2-dehydrogenase/D-chiro-inositol 3-dehydrogenase n=1 Tax=Crateriforma conspicua TaxID=2527996 RepID=A0A5C5Y3G3_9PLAN|nr:Gfo/Idh/MocA family oxidoreductase [Crateriforma conspicua]QDV64291.1 Inositol 2-dehydrogenase/D-chiro-inositol 3-dehydrogenase [Crateriforma conspicua]TWT69684.1 Inositol 2-dehydrogenase/D-chiro-inositol 3-dehydrogenase [Crateriforma conspicua]
MKLNLGLIGLGTAWQTRHRPALRVLQDRFDVRAVYGTVPKLAESCAAEFQADPVDGYRAICARSDIDAILVLERSWLGWLPALAACEAGKAVYWASDLRFDPAADREIRERIEHSGVAFMTEFPRRFAPATLRLKELIATRLGQPKMLFCHRRLDQPSPRGDNGHCDNERELVETIDWCRYVVGREPSTVLSADPPTQEGGGGRPGSGYRSLTLNFGPDGDLPPVIAQMSSGNYIPSQWQEALTFRRPADMHVCCERGIAFLDLPSSLVWFDDAGRHVESLDAECPVGEQLLVQFHRGVTSLVRSISDLQDAFRANEILVAAGQSSRTGQRIDIATD